MQKIKDNSVNVSITKVVTGLLTALVIGGIMGGFTVVRTSDATSLIVAGQGIRIDKLENDYVPRSELEQQFKHFDESLLRIEKSIDKLSIEIKESQ